MSTPIWITSQGLIGVYPAQVYMTYQLLAAPAESFTLISGELPDGLSFRQDGLIYGNPNIVSEATTSTFVIRAKDQEDIQDRTFTITITGTAIPTFTTPSGSLGNILDSTWQEIEIEYNNPIPTNPISIRVVQGSLPAGLEINEFGLIRGYPEPPITQLSFTATSTIATATSALNNVVTVLATYSMYPGRSIVFTGTTIGNIVANVTYFIKNVINATQIQLCQTPFGDIFELTTDTGFMDVNLPSITVGQPTKRQYTFTLELSSPYGTDLANYSLNVFNWYLPISQGGIVTNPYDSRPPAIYNTQPPTYNIEDSSNYGYFVLPPSDEVAVPGMTYSPAEEAYIGQFLSDEFLSFKIIGHDFDGDNIVYDFNSSLPFGLTGDSSTGWIYGIPNVAINTIEKQNFTVQVKKQDKLTVVSPIYNFSLEVANNINGVITWITDSNLGYINNATNCYSYVEAVCDTDLQYALIDGELPPNLELTSSGLIQGIVAYQPTEEFTEKDSQKTFTFTVRAYNPILTSVVYSDRTFTLTVNYYYDIPTDNLYIKCAPTIADRNILRTLLNDESVTTIASSTNASNNYVTVNKIYPNMYEGKAIIFTGTSLGGIVSGVTYYIKSIINTTQLQISSEPNGGVFKVSTDIGSMNVYIPALIPSAYIYRPNDPNFGKASSIIYGHAYGIYASDINQYIEASQKNHYWRNITLGQLKTASAKDEQGNIIYEVVYSDVIDNLLHYNPNYNYDYRYSTSVAETLIWPRFINLNLGSWYTSLTSIKTSFVYAQDGVLTTNMVSYDLLTQINQSLLTQQGQPTFYTSLTPGYAQILYPNSLENMSKRVGQELGADYNYRILPLWMTSQQRDGNTLGFTPAWVIAYTKPPIKQTAIAESTYHIDNKIKLDSVENLQIGGKVIFTGNTFGGIVAKVTYYVVSIDTITQKIQISSTYQGTPLTLTSAVGIMNGSFDISYADIIKNNIENNWPYTLNKIDFKIDRFTVNKELTYDFNSEFVPGAWTRYPSATPTPDPIDSENFYVLFPQKTILPTKTQINL